MANNLTKKQYYKIFNEWRSLNVLINQQINTATVNAGKPFSELPESDWKMWITELMAYRDTLTPFIK